MSKNTHISVEPNTPAEVKTRIPVWLYPSTLEVMDRAMKIANCKSRSEYLEKAALFYAGYVSGQDAAASGSQGSAVAEKTDPSGGTSGEAGTGASQGSAATATQ